mgnify:CR=1 FL=1
MAKIKQIKDCLAGIVYCYDIGKRALINPAVSLFCLQGIIFIFSENESLINQMAAFQTLLPGGYRNDFGNYGFMTNFARLWSSSEYSFSYAWSCYLYYLDTDVYWSSYDECHGFSVRCVRDWIFLLRKKL